MLVATRRSHHPGKRQFDSAVAGLADQRCLAKVAGAPSTAEAGAVADPGLDRALSARGHQSQLRMVNRVLPEPAALAVSVQVDGAIEWSFVVYVAIAVTWVMLMIGSHSELASLLAALGPLLGPALPWPTNVLLASRTRPLWLPWGAILAVNPSTVALVSVSPWSWAVSRGGTVKASWPRHLVVVDVAQQRRVGVRKVTVRALDGTTLRLEVLASARWVDPVLTDLAQIAATGVGQASRATSNWYDAPDGSAGLWYWDGREWTARVHADPWAPPRA